MHSPRGYYSLLKFKSDGDNIDDLVYTNVWDKNGNLDFSSSSKFEHLKYETRPCLRYDLKQAGYVQNDDGFELGDEFTLSFWFKVSHEILVLHSLYSNSAVVPLLSWNNSSSISVFEKTTNPDLEYGIKFTLNGLSITIPYDLLSTLNTWMHLMLSRDDTGLYRVFINGIKYIERTLPISISSFTNIKIGNPTDNIVEHPLPIYIYIDEISLCNSCITIDQFYPYPKYIHGFYPAVDIKDTSPRRLKAGKTKYDICNDTIPIVRPRYFIHDFGWEDDMITKYRFDRTEPFASSYFDKWMDNRDRPGNEYKKH